MKFNGNKCKVMHLGYNNPSYEYSMNDEVLIDTEEERFRCYYYTQIIKTILPYCTLCEKG